LTQDVCIRVAAQLLGGSSKHAVCTDARLSSGHTVGEAGGADSCAVSARSGCFVAVGGIPARQRMQVLSRGIQTDATSCDNRYGRRSRHQRRAPGASGPLSGITSEIWSRVDASSHTLCGSSCRSGIHDRGCCGFCKLAGERPAMRVRPQQVLGSGRGLSVAHVVRRSPSNAHAVRVQA
jgi:hypothetical protein